MRGVFDFFSQGLKNAQVRDRIYRILSIASILIAIGGSVVLVLAFMMRLELLIVVFSGVLTMALAFYLFIRLWPREAPGKGESDRRVAAVKKAIRAKTPDRSLTPEEYRRQRERAQRMIREKAAPALAKAIRGILRKDELEQRKKR